MMYILISKKGPDASMASRGVVGLPLASRQELGEILSSGRSLKDQTQDIGFLVDAAAQQLSGKLVSNAIPVLDDVSIVDIQVFAEEFPNAKKIASNGSMMPLAWREISCGTLSVPAH